MASGDFGYDINLFRSAITKTDRALSLLQGRNNIISELLEISESYDGEEDVNSACTIIREVLMTVGFLLTDMSATERQMEGIESSNIFGMMLSGDILGNITLDQLLEQLGAESEDDLLDFFATNYEFTEEELSNINTCLDEGKYNTILQLITGINRYKYYEELLQAASGDEEQEATINGMLIDEEKRINFIADYYRYYEALAQGELKNDNSSITDFDRFRNSAKYGSDAKSIMIAYRAYLDSNPDAQISGFDLLDYIGENDSKTKNMSAIDLETYLSEAYLNAADLYLSSNKNLSDEIGKILEYYPYMSEEDKAIYNYKREIEGESEANKFFNALRVISLEQKEGEAYGYDQLKGLLETNSNVVQFFDQSFDSFIRGGRGNLEDIANLFNPTTDLTANDYETMYILKTIQNINNAGTYANITKLDELKDKGLIDEDKYNELKDSMNLGTKYTILDILEEIGDVTKEQADLARDLKENGASEKALEIGEQLGYGIGYMAPSIAASVLTGGGALGKLVGNAVMFAGTAGGKVGEQLRSGATLGQAYGIALASAGFEVGSGYLLGRIPGLSKVSEMFQVGVDDTNAVAIAKIVLRALADPALEGIQEVSEDKVYSLITDVGRGREIDFDDISSLGPEEFKTFYMGALTSAVMNAPNNVITTATLPFKINGLETNLTLAQILTAYNEGGVSRDQFEGMVDHNLLNSENDVIQNFKNLNASMLNGDTIPEGIDLSPEIRAKYGLDTIEFTPESMTKAYLLMKKDGIKITQEELFGLIFDREIAAPDTRITNYSPEGNKKLLKEEILGTVADCNGTFEVMRKLYIELAKRLNYDYQYYIESNDTPENEYVEKTYNQTLGFGNLTSDKVVCKGWAELYRELLIDCGIPEENIYISTPGGYTGSRKVHRWIEVVIPEIGAKIIADATQSINGSNDLARAKMGAPLDGFVYTKMRYLDGVVLSDKKAWNPSILANAARSNWINIDKSIGYLNGETYFSDTSKIADKEFTPNLATKLSRSPLSYFQSKLDFPENMGGMEAMSYIKCLSNILLSPEDSEKITADRYIYYQNGEGRDYISLSIEEDGENYYMLYGRPTGKLEFLSKEDMDSYISRGGFKKW